MENTDLPRVRRIIEKLEQARARELSCYDSDGHEFQLNPPLSEAELLAFETEQRIRLPQDYRTFLTHAGNGGAGPYNGLFPFDKWDDFADWVEYDRPDDFLILPCPIYPGMPRADEWREQFDEISPYQGTLSLGSRGCSFATQLIVAGPYSGRVVYVDASDNEPPYIVREPDFLAWYERWLDELLQGYENHWFGYGPGGGEVDFLRILDDPHADDDFKVEAAAAFHRLPRLSDDAASRLGEFINSPLSGVRLGVLWAIQKFELRAHSEGAALLLEDPEPDVRKRAIHTLMKIEPRRRAGAVRLRFLEDGDESVEFTAFSSLKETGELLKTDLLSIITALPPHHLRAHSVDAVHWETEDIPLLLSLLNDETWTIRRTAVTNLNRLLGHEALPCILELLARETYADNVDVMLVMLGESGDPMTAPVLLEWAQHADDFHRLKAIEALLKTGDDRVAPLAQAMLQEDRPALRKGAGSSYYTCQKMSELIRASLEQSPNPVLRNLVS